MQILANWLRSFKCHNQQSTKIYASIVAQVRNPVFYMHYGIKDTITGRYELLAVHVALTLAVLRLCETANGPVSRGIVESFITDMDDNFREIGIGDMSVPKHVKKVSAGLLERSIDYIYSLKNDDRSALEKHLAKYLGSRNKELNIPCLIEYIVASYTKMSECADNMYDQTDLFANPANYILSPVV
ncbi:MAG: hypothetical protein TECD_00139 [Hyphomicrobiaceae bacterium hypho_1]